MRRPRTTKILLTGPAATFVYIKKDQPMVLKINNETGEVQWMYWDTFTGEIAQQ